MWIRVWTFLLGEVLLQREAVRQEDASAGGQSEMDRRVFSFKIEGRILRLNSEENDPGVVGAQIQLEKEGRL